MINVTSKCQATPWHLMIPPLWPFLPMYRTIFLKVVNCNHSMMNLSMPFFRKKFDHGSSSWHNSSPTTFSNNSTARGSLSLCYFLQHGVPYTVYVIHGTPHDRHRYKWFCAAGVKETRATLKTKNLQIALGLWNFMKFEPRGFHDELSWTFIF